MVGSPSGTATTGRSTGGMSAVGQRASLFRRSAIWNVDATRGRFDGPASGGLSRNGWITGWTTSPGRTFGRPAIRPIGWLSVGSSSPGLGNTGWTGWSLSTWSVSTARSSRMARAPAGHTRCTERFGRHLVRRHRRGHVGRNVAALAQPPRVHVDPIDPYNVDEVRAILTAAGRHPNGARWAIALALGLRQGEVLGLTWSDVDLDAGFLRVRSTRHRPSYAHGCDGSCGKAAGWCPQRIQTNRAAGDTKSDAGRRMVGLPPALVELLRRHRNQQETWRERARQLWQADEEWVFTSPVGKPLNPNSDYHRWKALLKEAGVRDGRLHDARHTAATVLLVLGVPERTVMGIMGWSSTAMAARYQHVTDPIRRGVAAQIGRLLWSSRTENDESE